MGKPVVLITGAASGIGRAAVELYAERGYSVVAVDVNATLLNGLGAAGGREHRHRADRTGATLPVDGGLSANGGILLPPALAGEATAASG